MPESGKERHLYLHINGMDEGGISPFACLRIETGIFFGFLVEPGRYVIGRCRHDIFFFLMN